MRNEVPPEVIEARNSPGAVTDERPPKGCLFCGSPLTFTFVDLGMSPLCESYVRHDQSNAVERFYPLHTFVCANCLLSSSRNLSARKIFSQNTPTFHRSPRAGSSTCGRTRP